MVASLGRRALLGLYALLIIVPPLVVVGGSLKTTQQLFEAPFGLPTDPTLDNYLNVQDRQNLLRVFGNSTLVVIVSVPATLILGSLTAYAVARMPGWLGLTVFGIFPAGLAVPAHAMMIPQYVQFDRLGLRDSLLGLMLVNIVVTLPVAVFILAGFMRTLPRGLYEAAELDGAGSWTAYRRGTVPPVSPSPAAPAIFLFVIHRNTLLYPRPFIDYPAQRTP